MGSLFVGSVLKHTRRGIIFSFAEMRKRGVENERIVGNQHNARNGPSLSVGFVYLDYFIMMIDSNTCTYNRCSNK